MIYTIDGRGNLTRAVNRVSNAGHWDIYRRALREQPELVEAMYDTVQEVVESERYQDPDGRFPNSTWLGNEILREWDLREVWDEFCGGREPSSSLFGEIMWTVLFDDERDWITTLTDQANEGREERVYWLART